jgi:hypothetical protein
VKPGDKLQKPDVIVTWGLLLVLFVGYEMYFVRGQEHFLQDNGFRSLAFLANQLNAKFAKVRASTESFVRLVHGSSITPEARDTYLKLYLDGPSLITRDEGELKKCATVNPENRLHVPLTLEPRGIKLILSVSCFAKDGSKDTIDLKIVPISPFTIDNRFCSPPPFTEPAISTTCL